jgi:hypothetical protein
MGREAAQEYERQAAVDVDPLLTARVRRIGSRLIAAGEAPPYPFEFHSVETNQINAFALPGGFIYVFRGLTQLMPGDDALAFIMAHEISHVTRRHGVQQLEKNLAISTLLNLALHGGTTSGVLQLVIGMHYSRHDEAEADRLGLALMAKAGFDPTQGAEAMAVIARAAKSERFLPALLRSHPAPESRIASLRREAQALQAAPHPHRVPPSAPPLPAPDRLPPPPPAIAHAELFPLAVGTRWTYRVSGAERHAITTTVLEELPEHPGTFRLRTELDEGVTSTRLVTVTPQGVCSCFERATALEAPVSDVPLADSKQENARAWQAEIPLPAAPPAAAEAAWETVHVPAGEYRSVRAVQRSPGGETATVWLAPGVGIVRRAWDRSGLVEELEAFQLPAPEESKPAAPPSQPVRGSNPSARSTTTPSSRHATDH